MKPLHAPLAQPASPAGARPGVRASRAWIAALALAGLLATGGTGAQPPAAGPDASARPPSQLEQMSPEARERLLKLSAELRCLVCQNQTLADSNADLAVDLRRQVETMVARGDDDETIKRYLVERYGDLVLYRPPVQRNTALLWFGPFALLLLGAVVWVVVARRSRTAAGAAPTDEAQRERARRLLDD